MKRLWSCVFAAGLWLAAFTGPAMAAPVGQVTKVLGSADVTRGETPAQPLKAGDPIEEHDVLRTKRGSLLEVTMSDGSQLTLAENTRLEVTRYVTGDHPQGIFDLARGKVRSVVTKVFSSRSESFRVRTPTAVVGVSGTDFVTEYGRFTVVYVYRGVVIARSADPSIGLYLILRPGQGAIIRRGLSPEFSGRIPDDFWGGGNQDLRSGGNQGSDSNGLEPYVPPKQPTPPSGGGGGDYYTPIQ